MKTAKNLLVGALLFSPLLACKTNLGGEAKLDTDKAKASYAVGRKIGEGMKAQGLDVDAQVIGIGIGDALAGKEARLKPEELAAAMNKLQEATMKKMIAEVEKKKGEGQAFLDANKTKPGVKVTASGLQYIVEKEGKGATPKASSTVKVHYTGTFINGEKFDSSVDRGEPIEFPVQGVIKGWTEALMMMKPGAKYKLFIPSDLAYGPEGRPGIPPASVLLFDVELISIKN